MVMGGCKGALGGVTVVRKHDMELSGRCERYKKGVSVDGEV